MIRRSGLGLHNGVTDKQFFVIHISFALLHCALASCGAVYCNRSSLCPGLWVVCLFVCLWVCYHDNSKLRASILTKLSAFSCYAVFCIHLQLYADCGVVVIYFETLYILYVYEQLYLETA